MDVYGPHPSEAVKGILQLRSQDLNYTTLQNSILHTDPDFLDNPSFVIRSRNTDDESYAMMNYKSGSGFMLKTSEPPGTGTADITFKPSGSAVLFLSSSGNVGIGTTSPTQKFEIDDGNLLVNPSGSSSSWSGLLLGFGKNLPTKAGLFGASDGRVLNSDGNLYISSRNVNAGNGSYILLGQRDSTTSSQKGTLILQTGTYNVNGQTGDMFLNYGSGDRVTLKGSTGNVGIGIGSPSSKLQVRGSGTTSATTALLVEDSNGNDLLKVTDDGALDMPTLSSGSNIGLVKRDGDAFFYRFSYGNNGTTTPLGRNIFIGKNTGNLEC
jgi:hypothetical protein